MAVPTSYTNDTFAEYLQKEVLMDTALELGWLDIYAQTELPVTAEDLVVDTEYTYSASGGFYYEAPFFENYGDPYPSNRRNINRLGGEGYFKITATGDGTAVRGIEASKFTVPAGTVLSFASGFPFVSTGTTNYTLVNPVAVGDTSITISAPLTGTSGRLVFYADPVNIVMPSKTINPVYQAIIDSTLLQLGETTLAAFTLRPEITKLRLFGRRETWKFAMQYLASDYSYRTATSGMTSRRDIYIHCKQMYIDEDIRIARMYGEVREQSLKQSQYYVPTTRSKVKVRW